MKPIVVIPVYDEAPTIGTVVAAAAKQLPVIVVDDGSSDATPDLAHDAGAVVMRHPRRLGKGQALRTGIAAARARAATHVVTLDGDGQHDPRELPRMLEAMRAAPRALVIGRRVVRLGALPRGRANALRVAGFFASWASGVTVVDTQSGFRGYPLVVFDDLDARTGGFVFETEILLQAVRRGFGVVEVDITVRPRATRRSRFRPVVDGAAVGFYLGRCVASRWVHELRLGVREATSFARPEVRRARHAAVLAEASRFGDSPSQWALSIGVSFSRRVSATFAGWARHPRLRRAGVAALGTAAMPMLAAAAVVQQCLPETAIDVVTPLVGRFYSQDRLDGAPIPAVTAARAPATPPADDALLAVSPPES